MPPHPTDLGRRLALVAGLLVLGLVACRDDAPVDPGERVRQVVAASVRHEAAMLGILEVHRATPPEAERRLVAYVREHEAELAALASQRDLLEHEPSAFAAAVQAHGSAMADNLARRRRLLESAPGLMAEPAVRAALGRLAAL